MAAYSHFCRVRIDHVGFGLVLGDDGKKFRSRSGDVSQSSCCCLLNRTGLQCSAAAVERRFWRHCSVRLSPSAETSSLLPPVVVTSLEGRPAAAGLHTGCMPHCASGRTRRLPHAPRGAAQPAHAGGALQQKYMPASDRGGSAAASRRPLVIAGNNLSCTATLYVAL